MKQAKMIFNWGLMGVLCSFACIFMFQLDASARDFNDFITSSIDTGNSEGIKSANTTGTSTSGLSDYLDRVLEPTRNNAVINTSSSGGAVNLPYGGPVFNGPGLQEGALITEQFLDDNVSKERDIKELIIGWINFLLSVTALIAVVALVWAGFVYITSLGDDSRMETAKKIIIWVVIGILIILAAYAIVNTVMEAVF